MSSTEQEHENFKKIKKLVFQVGLPLARELFVRRYNQNHGHWEETPEFGEKLMKILDSQNNSKETENIKKYEGRQNDIQSGKVSKWDYTTLQLILTHLDLGSSSTSNHFETENKMVHILTKVRNKLAHDYWENEKIPTEEFIRLWNKTFDSCFNLGAETKVMDKIMKSCYQNQNNRGHNSRNGQGLRSSFFRDRGHRNDVYSSFPSPQSTKETTTTTTNSKISTAAPSQNNYVVVSKIEGKNKVVVSSPSKPIISTILCTVKPSIQNDIERAAIYRAICSSQTTTTTARIYVEPSTFLSPSTNSASFTTTIATSSNTNSQQFGAPPIQTSSSTSGTVNTTENPDTQKKEEVPDLLAEYQTKDITLPQVLLMFLHGLFLLVVSSLFISRLMQQSKESPPLIWMVFTMLALCLGALRIMLSLFCFLLLLLKDSNARLWFCNVFGGVHALIVLIFGVLVFGFMLTDNSSSKFLDWNDVEGRKNYILYACLISALAIEPALVCITFVFLLVFGIYWIIKEEANKYN